MRQIRPFGALPDGRAVQCVTLRDGALTCEVITYGAALRTLLVPDCDGRPTDIVLGFDRLADYIAHDAHFGGTVGRFANRIARGTFCLNGVEYTLPINDGENHIHGGPEGFDRVLWDVERCTESAVALRYHSPDGEMGYPGSMDVRVTYALSDGSLTIRYEAVSDRDTLCNLTNHSYFNLSGHDSGDVLHHTLRMDASYYTPTDAALIPTGELASVAATPMDFSEPTTFGARIRQAFPALETAGGYDHNYVLDKPRFATVWSRVTGITLTAETDLPGVQLYTGNFLGGTPPGKGGAHYPKHGGFCLETQLCPEAPHHADFPSAVLRAGAAFSSATKYTFGLLQA